MGSSANCGITLQWRHNERDGVSNHQRLDCLLNRFFRRRSKKTSKLRFTVLCDGNSPVTGEFPAQKASNVENDSIWWRRHDTVWHVGIYYDILFRPQMAATFYEDKGYWALLCCKCQEFYGASWYIDGLVQERRNSSALAMELRLSCTNPSICTPHAAFLHNPTWSYTSDRCF